jgi:Fur family transcriptional regulator, ferric uptake regulator
MKRMTPLRQEILKLLDRDHLLTVPTLVEKLKKQHSDLNKTTVYRALEFLLEEGIVCRHNVSGNELSFELRDHHHDHLVCTNCGQLQTVDCLVHPPRQVGGFVVDHHHLTLYGLCEKCLKLSTKLSMVSP